ncbi:MAG TPA: TolC family protein, partial [Deltaproteobacteria bacterium]|nr:TolC family protein [Deltaproteobacteria bacterium]
LFEGGLRVAELKKARSVLRQKELEKYSLKRDIELEIRRLYNDIEKIASLVRALKKRLEFARENYRMALKQYRHGIIRSTDLVDAETVLVDAELSLMNAQMDYRFAIMRLKKSTGVLLEEALKRLPED